MTWNILQHLGDAMTRAVEGDERARIASRREVACALISLALDTLRERVEKVTTLATFVSIVEPDEQRALAALRAAYGYRQDDVN